MAGFEPTRAEPIGFQVQRLNHSATTAHDVGAQISWHMLKPLCFTWPGPAPVLKLSYLSVSNNERDSFQWLTDNYSNVDFYWFYDYRGDYFKRKCELLWTATSLHHTKLWRRFLVLILWRGNRVLYCNVNKNTHIYTQSQILYWRWNSFRNSVMT